MILREIILDTETTGLSPIDGHRVVEIGAVELLNHLPTGKTFHVYLNPERDMPKEAEAIHGLSSGFLKNQPSFKSIIPIFLNFIAEDKLIIHNASFDMAFLNAELVYCDNIPIGQGRVVDTLLLARKAHPAGPNSLDALCRRYGIDNSKRTKHGALLDAELLAEVYLQLIGGRQTNFSLQMMQNAPTTNSQIPRLKSKARENLLPTRLTNDEQTRHTQEISTQIPNNLWSE